MTWVCLRSCRSGTRPTSRATTYFSYWEEDERTSVALCTSSPLEPAPLLELRDGSDGKPIVAVKSGRTRAGQRAAGSHTGSLVAASDLTVDALFKENGVIRTDTLAEMFDVTTLPANQAPFVETASRSSRTRAASGSSARTRARRTG